MPIILRVAVPAPLHQLFDYLPPPDLTMPSAALAVGARVLVPFGRTERVGVVVEVTSQSTVPQQRLKAARRLLDPLPLLNSELLQSLQRAAHYYQHPLGEVLETALPVALRSAKPLPKNPNETALILLPDGSAQYNSGRMRQGARTTALAALLIDGPYHANELDMLFPNWRVAARSLRQRGWVDFVAMAKSSAPVSRIDGPPLNTEQQAAVALIAAGFGRFAPVLLEGITGSGKTEVYLELINQVLARGQQSLVLVPEIGLTPQLLRRFRERLPTSIEVMHSALSETDRARVWLKAAHNEAKVIIGTRSAVFTPLPNAGLVIIDEEHDVSYKQQDGFRYSARDFALLRGKALQIPVVLGSATPALETLANVEAGRYRAVRLSTRPGAAILPQWRVIDLRGKRLTHGLSAELIAAIRTCLGRGEQALVFKNRRGYAPVLLCHECGWHADCARCDKPLTLHRQNNRLCCHHCGHQQAVMQQCKNCKSTHLQPQGQGTERLEQTLLELFPDTPIIRIDRETTRRKDALQHMLDRLGNDQPGILVGTQMLAKGHDLPNLTLVAIVGVDEGLFSVDFRSGERLGQLIVQVSGRAGRALKPGSVWLQTHHPDHPLLHALQYGGYRKLAQQILAERQAAGFPPYAHLALMRAEATTQIAVDNFLKQAASGFLDKTDDLQLLGPMPAPMPRRAGRFRGQLLLLAVQRASLHTALPRWLKTVRVLPEGKRVHWSIDVDAQDLY